MFSPMFYLAVTIMVVVGTCSELNSTEAGVTTEQTPVSTAAGVATKQTPVSTAAGVATKQTPVSTATELAELMNCSFDFDFCNWNISVVGGGSNRTSPGWEIRQDEKGGFLWIGAADENAVHKFPTKKAELRTPLISREENAKVCLGFKYRLFGRGNVVDVLVRYSHRQSYYDFTLRSTNNIWKQKDLTINLYSGSYYLVFKATLGGVTGGIALDDLSVTIIEGRCPDVKETIEQLSAYYHERRLLEDLTLCSELLKNLSSKHLVSAIAHVSALKSYSEYRAISASIYSTLLDFRNISIEELSVLKSVLDVLN